MAPILYAWSTKPTTKESVLWWCSPKGLSFPAVTKTERLSLGTRCKTTKRLRKRKWVGSLGVLRVRYNLQLAESAGGVRSIYPQRPGRNDGNIYVGTTKNNILEGSLQRRFNQVVFGHGRQLWGLAVHPDDEVFATAGHDKNIALWRKNKFIWTLQVHSFEFSLDLLQLYFLGCLWMYIVEFPPVRCCLSCRKHRRSSHYNKYRNWNTYQYYKGVRIAAELRGIQPK